MTNLSHCILVGATGVASGRREERRDYDMQRTLSENHPSIDDKNKWSRKDYVGDQGISELAQRNIYIAI